MQTLAQPAVLVGPQPGELIPDFTVHTLDGRTIHRREYKGRRHLVLCFVPPTSGDLLTRLATHYPAYRLERADLLVALAAESAHTGQPYPLVIGAEAAELRRRFGVTDPAALIVCDRYGEVVLRLAGTAADLVLDRALAALQWLETRCSL